MRALRIVLQVVFALLSLLVLASLFRSAAVDPTSVAMLAFFIAIILVLGPWWPSADRKWKLNLPTDDPRVAGALLSAIVAAFSFYRAWSAHLNPEYEFVRLDRTLYAVLGRDGVSAFWIVIGLGCLGTAVALYKRGTS